MIDWLWNFDHLAILGFFYIRSLMVKGFDRLQGTLDALHEDFRKVHYLDAREQMETEAKIPGPTPTTAVAGSGVSTQETWNAFLREDKSDDAENNPPIGLAK